MNDGECQFEQANVTAATFRSKAQSVLTRCISATLPHSPRHQPVPVCPYYIISRRCGHCPACRVLWLTFQTGRPSCDRWFAGRLDAVQLQDSCWTSVLRPFTPVLAYCPIGFCIPWRPRLSLCTTVRTLVVNPPNVTVLPSLFIVAFWDRRIVESDFIHWLFLIVAGFMEIVSTSKGICFLSWWKLDHPTAVHHNHLNNSNI